MSNYNLKLVYRKLGTNEHGKTTNRTGEDLIDDGEVITEVEARNSMVNAYLVGDLNQEVNDVVEQYKETYKGEPKSEDLGHYNKDHLVDINCLSDNGDEELAKARQRIRELMSKKDIERKQGYDVNSAQRDPEHKVARNSRVKEGENGT